MQNASSIQDKGGCCLEAKVEDSETPEGLGEVVGSKPGFVVLDFPQPQGARAPDYLTLKAGMSLELGPAHPVADPPALSPGTMAI